MALVPRRVFFEEEALDYPLGKKLWDWFRQNKRVEVRVLKPRQRVSGIPGKTAPEAYRQGKRTLRVGVRKTLDFQTCKPSAHYQLPLVTGCMGQCEYCYLNTRLGKKPYLRVYVNLEEILQRAAHYIEERKPEITVFEGAAVSDPVPLEPYTGSLAAAIEFFADQPCGRFRFVTKYTEIDSLLLLEHRQHTTIRFSINADRVIESYEHGTPGLVPRLEAAAKTAAAGYPTGLMVGPVILFEGWEEEYTRMLTRVRDLFPDNQPQPATFEIISHRFTTRARAVITEVFPETTLPMDEKTRRFKYGQFGYGKYVYPTEQMEVIRHFFTSQIETLFPTAGIDYIV